jgi:hypothetical protein
MAGVYDRLGVRFSYPENWRLEEEEAVEWPRSISVESPVGAFWNLLVHPAGTDIEEVAQATLDVLRGEYEQAEFQPVWDIIEGRKVKGFDVHFFFLDLVIDAQVRAFELDGATVVILSQGEDRDFEQLENVFKAMTYSLVRESSGQAPRAARPEPPGT